MRTPQRLLTCSACWCLTLAACALPPEPTTAEPVRVQCPTVASADYFLPREGLRGGWTEPLLSRMLATAQMPSLSCGPAQFAEAYRYIAYNVFDAPPPSIVSATLHDSVWSVRTVLFENSKSLRNLASTIDRTRTLSNAEALALTETVRLSLFWSTPDPYESQPEGLSDGGPWVIEARRNDSYQAVRRWDPREEPIQTLGVMLVKLGGLRYELWTQPPELPPIPPPGSR